MLCNWLQVFRRAHAARLCSGGGPERETSPVPSEKGAVQCGSQDDAMRMITASFARVIERCTGHLCMQFLLIFQQVGAMSITCNQLLLKPYLRVFRGISKTNLPGYVGFFQFLRNFRQRNAFEQAELILQAALDPCVAHQARKGVFVTCLDHFDLLQTPIN
jgi:hypothetical protein